MAGVLCGKAVVVHKEKVNIADCGLLVASNPSRVHIPYCC
jgi:hypothetical protein